MNILLSKHINEPYNIVQATGKNYVEILRMCAMDIKTHLQLNIPLNEVNWHDLSYFA